MPEDKQFVEPQKYGGPPTCNIEYFFFTFIPINSREALVSSILQPVTIYRTSVIIAMICVLIILELIFMWVAASFSRRITDPIATLTRYTVKMTQAQDRSEKETVIEELAKDKDFLSIAEQYEAQFPDSVPEALLDNSLAPNSNGHVDHDQVREFMDQ